MSFDINEFLEEAQKSSERQVYGRFLKAVVTPGYWGYIKGRSFDDQFFGVDQHESKDGARIAAQKAGGENPRHALRFTQLAGTDVNDTEYPLQKDKVFYVHVGQFPWGLWLEHSFGGEHPLGNELMDKEIFVHVKSARHPDFDENDSATYSQDTVWWNFDKGQPKLDDDGNIRPQYYDYVGAAFATEQEIVDYALANGVSVSGATVTVAMPENWNLGQEVWDQTVDDLVSEMQANNLPEAVYLKGLASTWAGTGLTQDDLKAIYDAVR